MLANEGGRASPLWKLSETGRSQIVVLNRNGLEKMAGIMTVAEP
jgi:hypothetical protein